MTDTIQLTAECLCKKHKFSTEVPISSLPLEGGICHCDSCRHFIGALTCTETTWPQPKQDVDISALQTYQFSPKTTFRFCGTCSGLMFYESTTDPSKLGVCTGVLANVDADLIKYTEHIFTEDTKDGGASVWLKKPNSDDKEIPRFLHRDGEIGWDWPGELKLAHSEDESLPIWCHCKGIQLKLHRGNYTHVPRDKLPWFIDPRNNKRLASYDVCDSCRYQFGNDIVNWTFANWTDITQSNGDPFPSDMWKLKEAVDAGDPAVGTLAYYQSSPDVLRFFCKVCSASAFYACEDRAEVADIAVGLLEAPEGARAESFLSWEFGADASWVDDTKGGWREAFMTRVKKDAEEYRIARRYPESYRKLSEKTAEAES